MELPPRNILADTGPLFALIHAGDADHARAVEFARSFTGRLIPDTHPPSLHESLPGAHVAKTQLCTTKDNEVVEYALIDLWRTRS